MKLKDRIKQIEKDAPNVSYRDHIPLLIQHIDFLDTKMSSLQAAFVIIERLLKEWNLKHIPDSVRKAMNKKPRTNYKPRGLKKLEAQMNAVEEPKNE